jgi:curved DNA-binding protein CbpA
VIHEGRLLEQPLPELLIKLRRGKATVTVELGTTLASPVVCIEVSEGLIYKVSVDGEDPTPLADSLKSLNAVEPDTLGLAQSRADSVQGLSLERVLLEMGGTDVKLLKRAREIQIETDLVGAMDRLDKLRRFRITPSAKIEGLGVEPGPMMAGIVLKRGHAKRSRTIVLELGAIEARDGLSIDRLTERFGLLDDDRVVLNILTVPRRASDLLELQDMDPERIARLLRAMRLMGAIMGTAKGRAKAIVPIELKRMRQLAAKPKVTRRITLTDMPVPARDQKLLKDVESLIELDFFTLFDIDTETTKKEVNQAFLNLAQTWHPDRVQGRHPRLVAAITKLFAQINNARDTLQDRVLRETYHAHLKQNSGRKFRTQELSPEASRLECQKGIVMMRKNDFWAAGLHLKRAAKLDPKNKQVGALDLLCQIRDPKTDSKHRIHCLEEAGKEYPNEVELVFERAMEHFNRRNFFNAEELLREALDLRPHHREAERYMKLTKMRMDSSENPSAKNIKKGFF